MVEGPIIPHSIAELERENEELKKILNSKRYILINGLANSFYRIFKHKKQKPVNNAPVTKPQHMDKVETPRIVESGRVDIINVNFYDWNGNTLYRGGAERYVFDLACLLKKAGYHPRIIQGANFDFHKRYRGINVVGIKMPDANMEMMSRFYNEYTRNAELVIASPLELASSLDNGVPIIGINHGINFDFSTNIWDETAIQQFLQYKNSLMNASACVCVDTNFINWVRTRDHALSLKLNYVPNYYNVDSFSSIKHTKHSSINFVYPRRIYAARGYDITIQAFRKVLKDYKNVTLTFVGQYGSDEAKTQVEQLMKDFPNNVFHTEYSMDQMCNAYKNADVILIPTRFSEGTSLSCIEGMAAGAAVIATNVGGLPNLVINNYCGLLVNPTAIDIECASRKLIEDKALRRRLAKNASLVAKEAFSKDNWDASWKQILGHFLSI